MSTAQFSARIRWQSEIDPCFELETRHGGFPGAEEAALFANGFSEAAALDLRLTTGRLVLSLTNGSEIELQQDSVQVWELPDSGEEYQVADDSQFQLVPLTLNQVSGRGLDGGFVALKYGVLGPDQAIADVTVEVDETGLPEVKVHEASDDQSEAASFALGIIVRG